MTIRRKTARADVVKSVLESSKYENSADVIATFITQSDIARREFKEAQLLKQKKGNNNKNGGNRSNDYRSNNSNNRGRSYQNNQNGNNNQQQRGRNDNRQNRQEHTIRVVTRRTS